MTKRCAAVTAVMLTLSLPLGGCAAWQGAAEAGTQSAEMEEARGPGLFTGKRGGIIIDAPVWTGASPAGDLAE